MKFVSFILIAAAGILIVGMGFKTMQASSKLQQPAVANGFALVELFTSEGCSSCPAAEETVARLAAKNSPGVFILSYHVDYWDKLGWKDQFSSAAYTQKQREYASAFTLNSVYTPQAIVNGAVELVGSDEGKLITAINKHLMNAPIQTISFTVQRNDHSVAIDYSMAGDGKDPQILNLALVQPEAIVPVKRGENSGRPLHHVNIVRALKIIEGVAKGTVTLDIPADLKAMPLQVIAYSQHKKSLQVTGAQQKLL